MRHSKKVMSLAIVAALLVTMLISVFPASAAGTLASYYKTNPNGQVGVQKTINVDGEISDWNSSMIIAQGTANDDPRVYRPNSMYEVPLDLYTLYGAYDDNNLYLMWEMTNVQDVVAPNDDYPLSQGILYQTMNIPFFIAVDTGKSDAIGNKANLINGGTIWDSGITFENPFNRLVAISTNGANGPFLYSGTSAGLNPKEIAARAETGITFKYGKGILSKNVYGINGGYGTHNKRVPGDMCSENSDWVDFNTKGHKSSSMDFHYEMSIPLSKLGVTKSDVASNGIGAMVIMTSGKSGMDCLPYDLTMNDKADLDDSAGSQVHNSFEKSDEDHITVPFARIGKSGGSTPIDPQPGTDPTDPVQPTNPTTPVSNTTLSVNATSNVLSSGSYEAKKGDTISVKYDLKSSMKVCNAQWTLTYDSSKLKLKSSGVSMAPKTGGVVYADNGHVYGNFTEVQNLVDFTNSGTLAQAEFEVIGTGSASVNLNVEELSVGYLSGGVLNYRNAVKGSVKQNLSGVSGFSSSSISGTSKLANGGIDTDDSLTVRASSNFFKSATTKLSPEAKQVTVTYKLRSSMKLINTQWILSYDNSKLKLTSDLEELMPGVSNFTYNQYSNNTIKGNFTNINLQNYANEKDFVKLTFDVIGTGTANVDLDVRILGIAYKTSYDAVEAYIVDNGVVYDVTSQQGFSTETYTATTVITSDGAVWGDVNLDGKLSIMDATVIQRHLSTDVNTKLTDRQLQIADTNGDGKVSIMDATVIQRRIAGLA